jgi:TonB family protein
MPIRQVLPVYTQAAVRNRVEGAVVVDALVGQDGAVTCVEVTKSLDAVHGLDYAAVKAVQEWTLAPGTRMGIAIPVVVSIRVAFSLKREQVVATLMSPTPKR